MPITLPPRNLRVIDDDGFIDPTWYEFFTRFDLRALAKAWAVVTYSAGTPTLQDSFNVASIADTGTGDLTITLEKAFASANWVPVVSGLFASVLGQERHIGVLAITASTVEIGASTGAVAAVDPGGFFFAGLGSQ